MNLDRFYQLQTIYPLEYLFHLDLPNDFIFGTEIEYKENDNCLPLPSFLNSIFPMGHEWHGYFDASNAEIVTPPMHGSDNDWKELFLVCERLIQCDAKVNEECGAHNHVGAHFFHGDAILWRKALKLWAFYEDVVYYYASGLKPHLRPGVTYCSNIVAPRIYLNWDKLSTLEQPWTIVNGECGKCDGLNCKNIYSPNYGPKNTMEIRVFNGTLSPIILERNILFLARFFDYVRNGLDEEWLDFQKQNLDIINMTLTKYQEINFEKALELGKMIFPTEEELLGFLKIYCKTSLIEDCEKKLYKIA